jgi:hypothetical protein
MIEIRATGDRRPVMADGPHDPDSTRAIAAGIDSAARLLNYATMSPAGLRYPSDVYSVLGELAAAMGKLPQALGQMAQFISAEVYEGRARENAAYGDHGGDARAAHAALAAAVREASSTATALGRLLDRAQAAVRGLESTAAGEDG